MPPANPLQSTLDASRKIMSELQQQEQAVLDLPRALSIAQIASLRSEWQMLPTPTKRLVIDASEVQEVDTAGLQLLLAFTKECGLSPEEICFEPPASEVFLNAARLLGMNSALGIN